MIFEPYNSDRNTAASFLDFEGGTFSDMFRNYSTLFQDGKFYQDAGDAEDYIDIVNKEMSRVVGKVENPLPVQKIEVAEPESQTTENQQVKVPYVKTRKFKVGEKYYLYTGRNKKLRREYSVIKTIYTIQDKEVKILIMKQLKGHKTTKYTLNKEDCLKFHIKYEPGLEVFSMDLDWKIVKEKAK